MRILQALALGLSLATPVAMAEDVAAVIAWSQRVELGTPVSGVVERVHVRPGQAVATVHAATDQLVEPLTPREMEVLRLMAKGLTNQQIAEQLIIAVGTVKSYTAEIYGKLQVGNRIQAVTRAREIKLLD